ncbi:MAG: H+transporting two-sector ATPase C subunit [Rhodospirillales bacterium RIFCSPLOWO2_12_FULL_58_28]|nr:MAG: H+transporting two-sector ATPase C subunit [Rhodospirillales bacterium RIFCSPLOWO2_02_FULL_58_16]OHC77748.1 MAG: H+transporting two-sector ATPase C subunit [Rhodospirillales bacterium RIFCSPLOWO2_12_FULL_58_28]
MNASKLFITGSIVIGIVLFLPLFVLVVAPKVLAAEAAVAGGAIDPGIVQWAFLGAAVSSGLAALGAGYAVAMVGSAAVGAIAEKPELLGRLLIFVGLAEGIAIYGLVIAILILDRAG